MRLENWFKVLAVTILLASVGTVVGILIYSYDVVFVGQIQKPHVTLYEDQALTVPVPETFNYNLSVGNNTFNWWLINDGWLPVTVTAGMTKGYEPENVTITWDFSEWNSSEIINRGEVKPFNFTVIVTSLYDTLPPNTDYQLTLTVTANEA